jgi:hypothetical protein
MFARIKQLNEDKIVFLYMSSIFSSGAVMVENWVHVDVIFYTQNNLVKNLLKFGTHFVMTFCINLNIFKQICIPNFQNL